MLLDSTPGLDRSIDRRKGFCIAWLTGLIPFAAELFPIWNLPLRHPINIAYEAATADIGDKNVIDSFHEEVLVYSFSLILE
jgi:hypothetical protein